jgi:hypothetical protein
MAKVKITALHTALLNDMPDLNDDPVVVKLTANDSADFIQPPCTRGVPYKLQ